MRKPLLSLFLLTIFTAAGLASASAQDVRTGHSGLPVPRFVNLKNAETWGRIGPSFEHPVKYVFNRRDLPLQVVAETRDNVWRQVRDLDGVTTWVHRSQLVSSDMVLVNREGGVLLRKQPDPAADGRALLDNGVIVKKELCERRWCRVRTDNYRGWVPENALWGVN